jgi:hypothetical protein
MLRKKRLLLILPDSQGVRNFLHSNFLEMALQEFDVFIMHSVPGVEKHIEPSIAKRLDFSFLPRYSEGYLERFLRVSRGIAHIYLCFYCGVQSIQFLYQGTVCAVF